MYLYLLIYILHSTSKFISKMTTKIKIPKYFWQILIFLSFLILLICNPLVIGKLFCDDGKIGSKILYSIIVISDILILGILILSLIFYKTSPSISKNALFSIMMFFSTIFILFLISEIFLNYIHPHRNSKFINIGDQVFSLYGHTMPKHFTFDPVTGYALIPNMQDLNQKISTDQYGFRKTSRDYVQDKPSIIFVGDSTVFGWGVQDKNTFLYLLSENKKFNQFNFINMGVPSYSIGHISEVLKNKAPKFHPKVVFVAILWPWKPFSSYSHPDAWRKIDFNFYRQTIPLTQTFQSDEKRIIKWIPKTFLFLKDTLMKINYNRQIKENLIRPGIRDFTLTPEEEKNLALIHVEELVKSVQFLKSQGVKVVFYIHPYQYTVFTEEYKNLGSSGREIIIDKLKAYYPAEYLKSHYKEDPLFMDGCHLTDDGHQAYFDYFSEILEKLLNK